MGPGPKAVLALNKAADGLFPKEFILCSSLFDKLYSKRMDSLRLHRRLPSVISRHHVGWFLLRGFGLLSTGGHVRTINYLYWG